MGLLSNIFSNRVEDIGSIFKQPKAESQSQPAKYNPQLKAMTIEMPESMVDWENLFGEFPYSAISAYLDTWNVHRCVDMRSTNTSTLPFVLDKGDDRVDKHPVLDRITDRANILQSGPAWVNAMMSWYHLSGNSYSRRVAGFRDEPQEMWPLKSNNVKPILGDSRKPIKAYEYTTEQGKPEIYKPEEILHIMTFNPISDIIGLAPTEVGRQDIETQNRADEWTGNLLKKSAKPSMYVIPERSLTPKQREQLKREFYEKHQGSKNVGNIIIFPQNLKTIEKGEYSPMDMDFINLQKQSLRKICALYGVPPELMGDGENKTYSNQKEARQGFYMETVIPDGEMLCRAWNHFFFEFTPEYKLKVDKQQIEAIQISLTEQANALKGMYWKRVDELRKATNDEELGGDLGQMILVPATYQNLEDIAVTEDESEQPEPPVIPIPEEEEEE